MIEKELDAAYWKSEFERMRDSKAAAIQVAVEETRRSAEKYYDQMARDYIAAHTEAAVKGQEAESTARTMSGATIDLDNV